MSPKTLLSALRKCERKRFISKVWYRRKTDNEYVSRPVNFTRLADKIEKRLLIQLIEARLDKSRYKLYHAMAKDRYGDD